MNPGNEFPADLAAFQAWLEANQLEMPDFDALTSEEKIALRDRAQSIVDKTQRWMRVLLESGVEIEPGPLTMIYNEDGLPVPVRRKSLH